MHQITILLVGDELVVISSLAISVSFKALVALVSVCIQISLNFLPLQKLDFANNVQLSLTLAALSLGLWWMFDRSRSGFGLGITTALLATLITQLLVYNGVYQ